MKNLTRLFLIAPLVLSAVGCELKKSENPLSPTVAGPIPGVGISAPGTVQPQQGSSIPVDQQPISLVVENSTTTGVRPLTYTFELSTDVNFSSLLLSNAGISPGEGRTAVRLPGPLGPGRSYYWRARAEDGANTGPYSNPTVFNVFTPIVIDRPFPVSPINNATAASVQPRFVVNNAPRSGPATTISYELQVAENGAFAPAFATWAFVERAGQSYLDAPAALSAGTQYYWRIRAYDSSVTGPWSDTQVFKTPAAIAVPPPTGGGPSGPTTCSSRLPADIVSCHRTVYPARLSPADAPNLLRDIALDLNRDRPGYYGRLIKTTGNNCSGFACDIICGTDTQIWDVFGDGPDASQGYSGTATPQWTPKGTNSPCKVP